MSRWIFMFLPRSLCEDVISRLESHVSPSGYSHHHHRHHHNHRHKHPEALVTLGMCPLPPHPNRNIPIYTIYFSLPLRWPNRSRSIFQPAAFVSKQLYLLGYGLFSLALSLLFYHLSLSFGSVAYGTYDRGSRACVGNQKSMSRWAECGSKEELFAFLLKIKKRGETLSCTK